MERLKTEKQVCPVDTIPGICHMKRVCLAALALEALHKQVLPFLLRRLKEDVLDDLPPKIIQDYYCELSELQKHLYDDFSRSKQAASAETVVKTSGSTAAEPAQQHVFQSLQYLRKLCNHPMLVVKSPETIDAAFKSIGDSSTSKDIREIHHAPKLLALKYVETAYDAVFNEEKKY